MLAANRRRSPAQGNSSARTGLSESSPVVRPHSLRRCGGITATGQTGRRGPARQGCRQTTLAPRPSGSGPAFDGELIDHHTVTRAASRREIMSTPAPALKLEQVRSDELYDSDDAIPRDSPLLKPIRPKLEPSPTPPPEQPLTVSSPPSPSPGKGRKKSNRRRMKKHKVTQADVVLLRLLGGHEEVAQDALRQTLPSDSKDSCSGASESDYSSIGGESSPESNKQPGDDAPPPLSPPPSHELPQNLNPSNYYCLSKKNAAGSLSYTISQDCTDGQLVRRKRLCAFNGPAWSKKHHALDSRSSPLFKLGDSSQPSATATSTQPAIIVPVSSQKNTSRFVPFPETTLLRESSKRQKYLQ
ncbi:hypothetical protein QBC37DRAFT_488214 [Rhypophila decipiens]|uniref:Uncharacterized protein n=1 Tax=Rhypophila decipiens TaxID=261697 RepID=A0AAN6XVE0_9PEZI|nr:hypothetical protein QBC37DRAFT_488214 [Rhypophila decipiens]